MWRIADVVDFSPGAPRPPLAGLIREWGSLATYFPQAPRPEDLPRGDGHAVLVIPGILSADWATWPFRRFLDRCGYRTPGWRLGPNLGPTPYILRGLRRRLDALKRESGAPVSLIGVSLGGLLALDLAHDRPDDVRRVITLAGPRRLPVATVYAPLVRLFMPLYSRELDLARLARPLPVPAMSIHTREDGVLDWRACLPLDPAEPFVEVAGPHQTICRTPAALEAVARRLAEPRAPP